MSDLLQTTFIISLLAGMIRIATPILFGAMGELVTERSGVLNLSIEGTMLMGAFVGFLITYNSESLWLGVLAAMVAGALMGLLMAVMASTLKVDQTVTGLAMNGRGAVELVVASIGLKLGLINDEIFSILVLIAFVTTAMPPVTMKLYLEKIKYRLEG